MAGILIVIVLFVSLYTVFVPVLTLEMKHLKRGLLLLLVIGVFAFVLHLAGML
jgi:hypothetical protein